MSLASFMLPLAYAPTPTTPRAPNVVRETLVIEEWVVDYLRPTADLKGYWPWQTEAERKEPFKIEESQRGVKYMINGSYPGCVAAAAGSCPRRTLWLLPAECPRVLAGRRSARRKTTCSRLP